MVGYSASLSVQPASPVVNEPAAWTVTVTRSAPAPTALGLECAFFTGASAPGPDTTDASFASSVARVPATMASGATTATCPVPPVVYGTAAARAVARLQVFEAGGSVGLLGLNAPAAVNFTVRVS